MKFARRYVVIRPTTSLAEKIITGVLGQNPNINPQYSSNGFIWMLVTLRNLDKAPRNFDFSRIRLISDTYVINPEIIDLTPLQEVWFAERTHIQKIEPGKKFTFYLIFEYTKGVFPYKVVYDNQIAGKIYDKMELDVPERKL